ncbi:MAG: regulatory protein RecX [Elusimicrobiota bacterium]
MKITAIEPVKGKKKRYSIYVDEEKFIDVHLDTLEKLGIYVGKSVSSSQMDKIAKRDSLHKAREYALLLLTYRPRSRQEMYDKLSRKDYPGNVIEKVLNLLEKEENLDDKEFACWWIKQRRRGRPKGDFAIRRELKNKGIRDRVIDRAFDKVGPVDRVELAWKAVRPVLQKYKNLPKKKARRRLISLLKRRGFSWEVSKEVIQRFFS